MRNSTGGKAEPLYNVCIFLGLLTTHSRLAVMAGVVHCRAAKCWILQTHDSVSEAGNLSLTGGQSQSLGWRVKVLLS